MNNIFVGNLSFAATKEDVRKLFEPFGTVANVVIMTRKKDKSRGYGFVDMPNEEEKAKAMAALSGQEFMGRPLSIDNIIPKVKAEREAKKPAKAKFIHKQGAPRVEFPRREQKPFRKEEPAQFAGKKPWGKKAKPGGYPRREDNPFRKSEAPSKFAAKPWGKKPAAAKPWGKKPGAKPGQAFKNFYKVPKRVKPSS
jgi:RNA recognition motif-containing protein